MRGRVAGRWDSDGRPLFGSPRSVHEADLFWADLMGHDGSPPQSGRRCRRRSPHEEGQLGEASPAPRPIPVDAPVPFAPDPPPGSYWPVITANRRGREVNYIAADGSAVGGMRARQFLASRSHARRYHVGLDLFADYGDPVIAIADGRIVRFSGFCCGGQITTNALLVRHGDVVVNYGEVAPDSLSRNGLAVGDAVRAGQVIGFVGRNPGNTSMIHFETYRGDATHTARWMHGQPAPQQLLNPTRYVLWLRDFGRVQTTAATPGRAAPPPAAGGPAAQSSPSAPESVEWTQRSGAERMRYVMQRLVERYRYPVNAAAGIVGNLWAESELLPNRIEGSDAGTPMRALDFDNTVRDFSARDVMTRSAESRRGPRRAGIGLAQWTSRNRRAGLFQHSCQGRTPGEGILSDMDAQIDYVATELSTRYAAVERLLRNPSVTVNDASDEVAYTYEGPGAVFFPRVEGERLRKRPRPDPQVQEVFRVRRRHSQEALAAFGAGSPR